MMLVEDPTFCKSLSAIVRQLVADEQTHEDWRQELLLHAWKLQLAKGDQTWRWYLRNCWFYLKNRLRRQRRTDPLQHQCLNPWPPADGKSDEQWADLIGCNDSFMSLKWMTSPACCRAA